MSSHTDTHAWDADSYYRVSNWGDGFFGINERGNLSVLPQQRTSGPAIDIMEVIEEMKTLKVKLPTVIRFHDILRAQVKNLNIAFRDAIEDFDYEGRYKGVFPVKVNQMREVIEEVVDAGAPYDYGLEAGSKPEIMAALAYNTNKNSLTVFNGYKDREFMKLAMLGRKLNRQCIVIIEKFSELPLLIEAAREMNVQALIGLRIKLSSAGTGKWASSSGDKAKFGLAIPQILNAIALLKKHKMTDCIKLVHFHLGSQISDVRFIKEAVNEAARVYAKLHKMNIPIEYFDAGGGLAVDYDGSKSTNDSSRNYHLEEYAADIIMGLKQICDEEGVPHPNIVTESGRGISAHHSCVVTNVIDVLKPFEETLDTRRRTGEHYLVSNMRDSLDSLNPENFQETYNDIQQVKNDTISAFKLGVIDLEERAKIESMFWRIIAKINCIIADNEQLEVPEDLAHIEDVNSQKYLCNFSVFQSTADSWAINQILPIMPLSRLNEKPEIVCSFCDITCDSDGKIDNFSVDGEHSSTLRMHELRPGEPYPIGIFLTGAYQDVMGDMHNLFGRLNEVHVFCDDDDPSDFYIEEVIKGNSTEQVLSTMQYNPSLMLHKMKKKIDRCVAQKKISPREGVKLVGFYEDCLKDYTYLNIETPEGSD